MNIKLHTIRTIIQFCLEERKCNNINKNEATTNKNVSNNKHALGVQNICNWQIIEIT